MKKKGSSKFVAGIQKVGRAFFLPISILPIAGLLLGIGGSFTNPTVVATYGLEGAIGPGTVAHALLTIMTDVGGVVFANLPLLFALAVALGIAKNEKAVAVLAAGVSFLVMNITINSMLKLSGKILEDGSLASTVVDGTIRLRKIAADALDAMIYAARRDGYTINNVSAYRSIAYQRNLFNYYAKKDGIVKANKYSSKPCYSEHHTGLCADVSSPVMGYGLRRSYGDKAEGKWIARNAHKYGFIVRYPKGKEHITGYTYEPWHLRYLGVPLATYLYETKLSFEEFLILQQGRSIDEIK